MKKRLLYFVKLINHYTNSTLTPTKEAQSVVNYMFYKTDVLHVIAVNEEIEKQIKERFFEIRQTYSEVIEKIDKNYPIEQTKIIHKLND